MSGPDSSGDRPVPVQPFFVPQETPEGIRYVRPPGAPRGPKLSPLWFPEAGALAALAAATVAAVCLLVWHGASGPAWQLAAALLYPVQLVLDLAATARQVWLLERQALGEWEIELGEDRLGAGRRWGPFQFDARSLPVSRLSRLVVVRRPWSPTPGEPVLPEEDVSWDLVAEQQGGPPLILVSAYNEPEIIRPLARDLHARLARRRPARHPLPGLAEEEWTAPAGGWQSPGPLLPGGAGTWLALHAVGSVGLGFLLTLARGVPPAEPRLFTFGLPMGLLQGILLLTSFAYLKWERQARSS